MKIRSYSILVAVLLCFVTTSHAQPRNYDIKNGFAIGGGITQFNLNSKNFQTDPSSGWIIQASTTVDLPHKFYNLSYNIQLAQNKFDISGRQSVPSEEAIPIAYEIFTAQIGLVWHIKILESFLTLDLGPQLQYNSDLTVASEDQEGLFLNGFSTLRAEDIVDITNYNINGMAGLTAGVGPFKIKAQYIYGFLNTFASLKNQDLNVPLDANLTANMSMWAFTAQFTF